MKKNLKPILILLAGPAGCGKTQVSTEAFEKALSGSQDLLADDLLLILPTAEHRARTLDLVLRRGLPGFFQRRITTFDRALKEFLKLGGLDFATDVTRRMILKEILSTAEFQYFKGLADRAGFLELLGRTVVELKEYLISPDEFKRRLEPLKKRFPEFELKYADLEKIYAAYERELKRRSLIDQHDSLRLLEEGLERGEFANPNLQKVWIDGFSDFTKLQLSFIEFLTRHADEVTVTLTIDQDPLRKPLFQIVSDTQTALEDIGFKKKWMEDQNYRAQNDILKHLQRNLFRDPTVIARSPVGTTKQSQTGIASALPGTPPRNDIEKIPADASIQVFEATGLLGEVEMIAREIKHLVRTRDYHFSDIAVLFRATDPYRSVIQSVFRKFQIPVEIHERTRLRTNPIARTFVSFFNILLNDWNRKDIFNFLKSSYVHFSRRHSESFGRHPDPEQSEGEGSRPQDRLREESTSSGSFGSAGFRMTEERLDYELVCELELRALQKGIFKDRSYWLRSFPESKAFQQIAHFEDEFLKIKCVEQFTIWVKAVMNHFGLLEFPDSGDDPTTYLRSEGPTIPLRRIDRWWDERTRIDREAARRIMLLLEELKQKRGPNVPSLRGARQGSVAGDESIYESEIASTAPGIPPRNDDAIAFAQEFLTLMDVDLFSVHARDRNRVQIYNVSLARQKEYKAVFLAGLLEKQFPIQVKEDPVLSDRERRALNEKGEVLKERLPRQAFERYLFYLAATRACEHLILSYPRFNLEGKESLPSFYVEEVRKLFEGELSSKRQHMTDVLPKWEDIATREEAEQWMVKTIWSVVEDTNDGTGSGNVIPERFYRGSTNRDSRPDFQWITEGKSGQSIRFDSPAAKPQGRLKHAGMTSSNLSHNRTGTVTRFREDHIAFALYNHLMDQPAFGALIWRLLHPIEGMITDERIKQRFLPERGAWSSTLLEEYAECPYRFFSHRLLGLESQTEGVDLRRRGTILHDVLEQFFTWRRDEKRGSVNFEEAQDFCLAKFRELWNQEPLTGDRYYRIELERKKMQEMITQVLQMELVKEKPPIPGLVPKYFEYEFKDLVLKGDSREIVLRGKIDRIDVDPTGKFALVIDYKTGKKFDRRFLENGVSLQLPFYLIAAHQKLGLQPLGGHLYLLSKAVSTGFHHQGHLAEAGLRTKKGVHFTEKEFDELLKRSIWFAERFVEGIERAEIPVKPRDCVPYCPYSSVCRIEKWRLKHIYREIKAEDKEAITRLSQGNSSPLVGEDKGGGND